MIPKPKGLGPEYGAQFKDRSVVEAYHFRPSYPAETFEILANLITDEPRAVLDVGSGSGDIARNFLDRVERIDAVDFSAAMIEKGKRLPGGDNPRLNWIYAPIEEAPLFPPYALITAGSSLHWMEWDMILPRFRDMLTQRGYLAVIEDSITPTPWHDQLLTIIQRFSTNRDFQPYDTVKELETRGLFQTHRVQRTMPTPFIQSVDDYIESFHARNGFSRERMSEAMATAFDNEVRELVTPFSRDGMVELQVIGEVVWGRPI